jgi:hypothetical protein
MDGCGDGTLVCHQHDVENQTAKHAKNRKGTIEEFCSAKISNIWRSWRPWRFIFNGQLE